jgi:hypothetical protein
LSKLTDVEEYLTRALIERNLAATCGSSSIASVHAELAARYQSAAGAAAVLAFAMEQGR